MPAFTRTVTPFLRSARSALQHSQSINPLQQTLRSKGAATSFTRAYAAAFERTKPHVNIGGFRYEEAEFRIDFDL